MLRSIATFRCHRILSLCSEMETFNLTLQQAHGIVPLDHNCDQEMRMTDLYEVSGTSPTDLAECTMMYTFRIRTAKSNSRPGRWINSSRTFTTLEAADLESKLAFNKLWWKVKCRIERQVLGVFELFK